MISKTLGPRRGLGWGKQVGLLDGAKLSVLVYIIVMLLFGSSAAGHETGPSSKGEGNAPAMSSVPMVRAASRLNPDRMCQVAGSKGPWDEYQMRDLPQGSCAGSNACAIRTKDSCPGTTSPGPSILWQCTCVSGLWQCYEQERTKTACMAQ